MSLGISQSVPPPASGRVVNLSYGGNTHGTGSSSGFVHKATKSDMGHQRKYVHFCLKRKKKKGRNMCMCVCVCVGVQYYRTNGSERNIAPQQSKERAEYYGNMSLMSPSQEMARVIGYYSPSPSAFESTWPNPPMSLSSKKQPHRQVKSGNEMYFNGSISAGVGNGTSSNSNSISMLASQQQHQHQHHQHQHHQQQLYPQMGTGRNKRSSGHRNVGGTAPTTTTTTTATTTTPHIYNSASNMKYEQFVTVPTGLTNMHPFSVVQRLGPIDTTGVSTGDATIAMRDSMYANGMTPISPSPPTMNTTTATTTTTTTTTLTSDSNAQLTGPHGLTPSGKSRLSSSSMNTPYTQLMAPLTHVMPTTYGNFGSQTSYPRGARSPHKLQIQMQLPPSSTLPSTATNIESPINVSDANGTYFGRPPVIK
ncbi:periplasmic copper-binding protein, partial [Reticulomyxa filosa]